MPESVAVPLMPQSSVLSNRNSVCVAAIRQVVDCPARKPVWAMIVTFQLPVTLEAAEEARGAIRPSAAVRITASAAEERRSLGKGVGWGRQMSMMSTVYVDYTVCGVIRRLRTEMTACDLSRHYHLLAPANSDRLRAQTEEELKSVNACHD